MNQVSAQPVRKIITRLSDASAIVAAHGASSRVRKRVAVRVAATAITALFAISACSSGATSTGADSGASSGTALKIIFVTSDPTSDEVGARVYNGFMAAGQQLGVDTVFRSTATYTTDPAQEKALIEDAIATRPAGLVISDPVPSALNATIRSATEQGIPVVLTNTGLGEVQATGALTYVGNDETASGALAGQLLGKAGARHAVMLTVPPGIPITDQRLAGFQQGFPGTVTALRVPLTDSVAEMKAALLATLQKDPSIDAVMSAGSLLTPAELAAEAQLGGAAKKITWAAIDVYPQVLQAIKGGQLAFALDQQPYLEGYLPVLYLKQYLTLGLKPVGALIATGPVEITPSNVDQVIALSNEKLR
jgi:simple sugar transport system substrate-binding protein